MVEITLFEIHLENADFDAEATATAPLSGLFGDESGDETDAEAESTVDDSGGPSVGKLVVGALLLAALAAVALRLLGGGDIDDLVEVSGEPIEVETDPTESETES